MKSRVLFLMSVPALLLTACARPPSSTAPSSLPQAQAPTTVSRNAATDLARTLSSHHWRLEHASDAQGHDIDALFVRADAPIRLDFANGKLAVSNACNTMGASFRLDGATVRLGPMISTKMACADPAVMALDSEVGRRLQGALEAELVHGGLDRLILRNAAGDRLRFVGEATAEARFGGPGETVFLEINARTAPCRHGEMVDARCLQTRELRYDENGVRIGAPGEWQAFYDTIEGYRHEEGTRNVLRVKRYRIPNPPADASSLAYTLEMVIETETAPEAPAP